MSAKSKIGWTQATWNPVLGCSKISPGCKHCYAISEVHRMARNPNRTIQAANSGLTVVDGETLDRLSDGAFRRTSTVPWHRLLVSLDQFGNYQLTTPDRRFLRTFEKRRDAKRAIQRHYATVRARLDEGCHC